MLKQRVITAVVLLLVLAGSVILSPLAFAFVMTFAVAAAIWEWLRMLEARWALPAAAVIGIALYAAWALGLRIPEQALAALVAFDTALWLLLTYGLFKNRAAGFRLAKGIQAACALLMLPLAWYSAMWLFERGGWQLVITALLVVWVADIAAYFCGRFFGRNRMAPAISPKKTWEGAAGAYVFNIAALFALGLVFSGRADVFQAEILSLLGVPAATASIVVLTLLSMAGDLLESAAKRQAGIKDSSNLLPGHGGFYDRLDACVPVLPAAVLVLLLAL